ncbi:hypothetical protein ACIHCM_35320 [Streptomyces sp. NPDC052023]|uniref:hypothetical protein n=1 Tax=Streptomyces sp. NPDC052023 TaxID=3365681 RepID=UPI0037CF3DC8
MAFKKFTQCYEYQRELHPSSRPFKKSDLLGVVVVHAILALTLWGSITLIGAIGGPVGLAIGAIVGFFTGIITGVATAIKHVSYQWHFHRLICLSREPKCAVGTVREEPKHSAWRDPEGGTAYGDFDNDEYFDVILMPHRPADNYDTLHEPPEPESGPTAAPPLYGTTGADTDISANPRNEIYLDNFQGQELLRPKPHLMEPDPDYGVGYINQNNDPKRKEIHTASTLHCEAEGDFWVRMNDMALWFGTLATVLVTATAAGASAGGWAGATAGCALGSWFFGPVGCLIGAVIGALLGALAGGAAAAALGKALFDAVLKAVFYATPGEVEDANVGDKALGPIRKGSRVAVLGEHVYDGFHQGWHELHPLMAVVKIEPDSIRRSGLLTWDPKFSEAKDDVFGLDQEAMLKGLESTEFAKKAAELRDAWCSMLHESFDAATRQTQQKLEHRWTIHPLVDGCEPVAGPGPDVG